MGCIQSPLGSVRVKLAWEKKKRKLKYREKVVFTTGWKRGKESSSAEKKGGNHSGC
jgi:hypothetical protein